MLEAKIGNEIDCCAECYSENQAFKIDIIERNRHEAGANYWHPHVLEDFYIDVFFYEHVYAYEYR